MKKYNICILEPEGYQFSGAFYEISDLLKYALRELGHEVTTQTNGIEDDACNILIGIHLLDAAIAEHLPADTIILNTEQLGGVPQHWNENIVKWFSHNFTLWDYSDDNIEYLKAFGAKKIAKFKFGFQKELSRIDPHPEKDIDVLFYGCINERRRNVLQNLHDRGLRVAALKGVFGEERDKWIARSRLVLNHHYFDTEIFEIVRAFYLMTNGVPVVAEINPTTKIDDCYRGGILGCPYDGLVEGVVKALQNEDELIRLGAMGEETISRLPQTEFMREIL